MKHSGLITLIILLGIFFAACVAPSAPPLAQEVSATPLAVEPVQAEATQTPTEQSDPQPQDLSENFAKAEFSMVAGQYTRLIETDEATTTELFALEKQSFVQIVTNDVNQEVFAYNYFSDDFTYLYYFDGDLAAKTKINLETGAVLQDDGGYADLLLPDAENLKLYFYDILEQTNLTVQDLLN